MVGALSVIKARAPVTGGNFGVWGGMFSTFDCAVKGWRQKEDMWNAIISGFMTGGCLAARSKYIPCHSLSALAGHMGKFDTARCTHCFVTDHPFQVVPEVPSRLRLRVVSSSVCSKVLEFSCRGYSMRALGLNYHHVSMLTMLFSTLSPNGCALCSVLTFVPVPENVQPQH